MLDKVCPQGHLETLPWRYHCLGRLQSPLLCLSPELPICNLGKLDEVEFKPVCSWDASCGSPVCWLCPGNRPIGAGVHFHTSWGFRRSSSSQSVCSIWRNSNSELLLLTKVILAKRHSI